MQKIPLRQIQTQLGIQHAQTLTRKANKLQLKIIAGQLSKHDAAILVAEYRRAPWADKAEELISQLNGEPAVAEPAIPVVDDELAQLREQLDLVRHQLKVAHDQLNAAKPKPQNWLVRLFKARVFWLLLILTGVIVQAIFHYAGVEQLAAKFAGQQLNIYSSYATGLIFELLAITLAVNQSGQTAKILGKTVELRTLWLVVFALSTFLANAIYFQLLPAGWIAFAAKFIASLAIPAVLLAVGFLASANNEL